MKPTAKYFYLFGTFFKYMSSIQATLPIHTVIFTNSHRLLRNSGDHIRSALRKKYFATFSITVCSICLSIVLENHLFSEKSQKIKGASALAYEQGALQ